MAHSITGLRVQHHFGRAGGATGEVNNPGFIARRRFGIETGIGLEKPFIETGPSSTTTDKADPMFQLQVCRFVGEFFAGQKSDRAGSIQAIFDVPGSKERCAWNWDHTKPDQAQHSNPPLRHPRGDDKGAVASSQAKLMEKGGGTAELVCELVESELFFSSICFPHAP